MKGLYRKKYAKAIVTILTVMFLTALAGGSYASASGLFTNSYTVEYKNSEYKAAGMPAGSADVTEFGADGGDKADDTNAIQAVLNNHDSVYIPDGIYYINVDRALQLKSGQTLTLGERAVLRALPTSNGYYSVIEISSVGDVTVTGGQIVGERSAHTGSSGEWGMGINILESNRVTVTDVAVNDCWGDGIYIGGTQQPSRDITIDGVTCDNNRRQGLSITYAVGVEVTDSVFKNTHGARPAAGIDIEPNEGEITEYITVRNTECFNNEGCGLDLMGCCERVDNITVIGCTFRDNQASGIRIVNAGQLRFEETVVTGNHTGIDIPRDASEIEFAGVTVEGNSYRGVSLVTASQDEGTSDIIFESCAFKNNSQASANDQDGIRIDNYDTSGAIQNVTFTECRFADDQASKTQRYGLTVGYSGGINGITVERSCTFSGNISGAYLGGGALTVL